ncbi:hypothetical protein OUZ56_014268 [Daphnia magna]|uniref:Uncharacterized protein n=1 Tax=Daphnia magna TaxID=35525 RepID=A0ABR0AJB8_9CRUS|nr:hypothetical protein OUZ56_014268 [Daphnia magna]
MRSLQIIVAVLTWVKKALVLSVHWLTHGFDLTLCSSTSSSSSSSRSASGSNYRQKRPSRKSTTVLPPPSVQDQVKQVLLAKQDQGSEHGDDGDRSENDDQQQQPPNSGDVIKFKISSEKGNSLRKLVQFGLPNTKARAVRNRLSPRKFRLCLTELDDFFHDRLDSSETFGGV